MGEDQRPYTRRVEDGGESVSTVLRVLGAAVLGSSFALWGWALYTINTNQQRLAKIETKVEQFHDNYYREQQRHESIEKSQWDMMKEMRDYLRLKGWSGE